MARELWQAALDEPCPYLADLEATTDYRILTEVTPEEHEEMIVRGWRRFGMQYFRPCCAGCAECVSLRVPVATFEPTRSQRRAWRKSGHLTVKIGAPQANEERVALFHAWHAMREDTRGWKPTTMTLREYALTFCTPNVCAREMSYFDGERLVAIGHIDVTSNAVSSIYFFYHPNVSACSLGVASVLFEIEWARRMERPHLYLGYRVSGCPSTAYKSHYGPHELLQGRPEMEEAPVWR
ncbi:MAG: arginyltransferase [Chthoniobacter sp.]|nr:arginyltransferase [Chthoniobacter sp.]